MTTSCGHTECGRFDWGEARRAAAVLLKSAYRVDIRKALDPLNDKDFLVIAQQLADRLAAISGPLEKAAVQTAIDAIDFDLATATRAQAAQFTRAVNLGIRNVGQRVAPQVGGVVTADLTETVGQTKVRAKARHNWKIDTSFNRTDQAVVRALGKMGTWVTDEYGQRAAMAATSMDRIIADGVSEGLRAGDIAERLRRQGDRIAVNQAKNYWQTVALNASNRARNYGHLSSMEDAGVQRYVFLAVMDERTTEECRMLNEMVFSVGGGLQQFRQLELESQNDSDAAERLMPFVQRNGAELYVAPPGGARTVIGHVASPGMGTTSPGSYSNVLPESQLAAAGCSIPPLHHRCRSTLLPDI